MSRKTKERRANSVSQQPVELGRALAEIAGLKP